MNAETLKPQKSQKTLRDVTAKDFMTYPDKVTLTFADINVSTFERSYDRRRDTGRRRETSKAAKKFL